MCSQVQDKKPETKEVAAMPAALTRFVQACFTAADATVDKAAMMVGNRCLVQPPVGFRFTQCSGMGFVVMLQSGWLFQVMLCMSLPPLQHACMHAVACAVVLSCLAVL